MKTMQYFKVRLKLLSSLATPLAADTLFGHLCWSIVYGDGEEKKLAEFLDAMSGQTPPILLSDPFPKGMLPVPVLPSINLKNWAGKSTEELDRMKDLRKRTFMSQESFTQCCGKLAPERLLTVLAEGPDETKESGIFTQVDLVPHNRVDRFGHGTVLGGVFFTEETFVDPAKGAEYDLYVGSTSYSAKEIETLLLRAVEGGYGSDKSTGRGVIKITAVEPWTIPSVANPNAVMLLGPCAPAQNDPTQGFWKIKAKAGRLGGHWAISENPFKKTIMMLQAGSVLQTPTPKPFYGRMVENAHPELPQVRHYGLALALPIHLEETEEKVA